MFILSIYKQQMIKFIERFYLTIFYPPSTSFSFPTLLIRHCLFLRGNMDGNASLESLGAFITYPTTEPSGLVAELFLMMKVSEKCLIHTTAVADGTTFSLAILSIHNFRLSASLGNWNTDTCRSCIRL